MRNSNNQDEGRLYLIEHGEGKAIQHDATRSGIAAWVAFGRFGRALKRI